MIEFKVMFDEEVQNYRRSEIDQMIMQAKKEWLVYGKSKGKLFDSNGNITGFWEINKLNTKKNTLY